MSTLELAARLTQLQEWEQIANEAKAEAEAISAIQALAILAVSEIATETLEVIQSHKVTVSERYACIRYPNGNILEYIIEQ